MNRRFFTMLCALLCFCLLLGGCNTGKTEVTTATVTDSQTEAATEPPEPAKTYSLSDYSVVRPDSDKFSEVNSATGLRDTIKELCGFTLKMDNDVDRVTNPDNAPDCPMLLIGHTNFDESAAVIATLGAKDYAIVFTETNKIVITGGSQGATAAAVLYFTEHYLESGKTEVTSKNDYRYDVNYDAQADIVAVSLNLRTATSAQSNTQSIREPLIVSFIQANMPDSFGTQECENFWRYRLDEKLAPLGYVRAQPITNVTKNYIWYNSATTNLIDAGVFWLSETPEQNSKGFGSSFYISCCWALLENKATGAKYVHMNTHLDVNSEEIRKSELTVLIPRVKKFIDSGYAVFVTGDFNSLGDSPIYSSMTAFLGDSRKLSPITTAIGTFNNFDLNSTSYVGPIDYCFVNSDVTPTSYAVIDKIDGAYMSDHNALLLKLTIYKTTK